MTSRVDDDKEIIKKEGYAKVVTANNIIAHTDTVKELFEGVKELIGKDGVFIFETHWVRNLIGEGGFDQVYHEHLCYYSLHALRHMVESVGLKIFDVCELQDGVIIPFGCGCKNIKS